MVLIFPLNSRQHSIAKLQQGSTMKTLLLGGTTILFIAVVTLGATVNLDDTVSIRISLSMTWSDFCLLETYFKTKLAEEVIDRNGQTIESSRIILYNLQDHCPAKDRVSTVEGLVIYVSTRESRDTVDVTMTKKVYKILHYVWENKLDGSLGSLFRKKLTSVKVEGKEAPPKPSGTSELTRTYVAIGIALAVIAVFIILMAIVYVCRRLLNLNEDTKERTSGYRSGYDNNANDEDDDNGMLEEDHGAGSVAVKMGTNEEPITQTDDQLSTRL